MQLCEFSLANNVGFGQYQKTVYYKCKIWGKQADGIKDYLVKGKQVAVTGELTIDEWTGNDGQKRQDLQVNCKTCVLLSDGKGRQGAEPAAQDQKDKEEYDIF